MHHDSMVDTTMRESIKMLNEFNPSRASWRIILILLLLASIIILAYIFYPLTRPTPSIRVYPPSAVVEICNILNLDLSDDFCANSSEQNAITLETTLYRVLPIEKTTFQNIRELFSSLRSRSNQYGEEYEVDGCRLTQVEPTDFQCNIIFPGGVGRVIITFSEGIVDGYRVQGARGGS